MRKGGSENEKIGSENEKKTIFLGSENEKKNKYKR